MAEQTVTLQFKVGADGVVAQIKQVGTSVKAMGEEAERAGTRTAAGFGRARQGVQSISDQLRVARQQLLGFAGITLGAGLVRQIVQTADAWTNLNSKIGLVTDSQAQANAVLGQVFDIAQRTRSELAATGELYTRLARATADADLSQRDLLQVTETINQAFIVSGASSQEATNAIIQLSQGLAAGALRGEEFNSVAEQAPILMDLLGKSLGKSRGELRAFAAEGGITTEVITGALLAGAEDVQTKFDGMAVTIAGASTQLSNAAARFVGGASEMSGAASTVSGSIQFVARNFDLVAGTALALGTFFAGRFVLQLGASALAWGANTLQVIANTAALRAQAATSPLVARGLLGVTVAASGLGAALGPISIALVAVAAGVALFTASTKQSAPVIDAEIDRLKEQNAQLLEQARLRNLIASGAATGQSAPAVDAFKAQAEEIERLTDRFQRLRDMRDQALVTAPELADGLAAVIRRTEEAIEGARQKSQELAQELGKNAALSGSFDNLPPTMKAVAERTRDAVEQMARFVGLGREAAALEPPKFSEEFSKSLQESIDKLRDERTELQRGIRARLVDQALRATGAKSVEELDQATRDLIDTLTSESKAVDALKDGQRQRQKDLRESGRAAEEAIKALADFRKENQDLAAELAGPGAQSLLTYTRGLDEAGRLFAEGVIGAAELTERVKLLTEQLDQGNESLRKQQDVFGPLLEDLEFEGKLIGLSNTEREVAIALRQVEQALQQSSASLTEDEIAAEKVKVAERIRANAAQQEFADLSAQVAADYERNWVNAVDGVAFAFGDLVTGSIRSFKDLGRQLKDIARSFLADLVTMFARNKLLLNVGTAGGGPGGAGGGLFGGLLGGVGGGAGASPFNGTGPLRSFQNPASGGSLTGALGSIFGKKDGTTLGGIVAAAQSAAIGSLVGGLFGGKGSTGGALGGALGQAIGGPVGAAIGSVLGGLVGGLFGRKFKTSGTGAEFSIGEDGADGFAFEDQKKKKLFGGSKRRTITSALDPDAQRAIDDLFDAVSASVELAARALAIETPGLISGSFRAEFDKDGNLVKQFSTIAGQVVNESQEAFAQRLQAVNVLAVIDRALGPISTDIGEAIVQPVVGGFEDFQAVFGDRIEDLIGRSFSGPVAAANQAQGEASRIAQRWAGDAEQLLAGAQFLLAASVDMRNGFGLLGTDGTLTDITALVEDLASAGEPLIDTYARLVASAGLLEQALALQNQTLDLGRAEFVKFAADIASAAGGLDRAQALWTDYFNRFFSDNERAAQQLTATEQAAQREAADIGLNASDFTSAEGLQQFRELFELALPTLSADAVVQWLEAASAIGLVIDAQDALNESLGDVDRAARELAEAMAEDLASLLDGLRVQAESAADALADFGLGELAAGLQQVNREIARTIDEAQALGASEAELAEIRALGAARAELLQRQARAELDELLDAVSQSLFELDATPLEIELSRLSRSLANALTEAAALGASEEQLALIRQLSARESANAIEAETTRLRAEAEQRAAQLAGLLDGVSQALFELDATPLEIELSRLSRSLANALTEAAALGASEEQLALIRQLSARESANAIEAETARLRAEAEQRAAQLAGLLDGVSQALFELDATPLEIELSRLSRSLANALTEAAALGASEEQLALIRQLSARESANAIEAEAQRMRDAFAALAQSIAQTRTSIADDVLSIRRTQPGFSESAFQTGRIGELRSALDGASDPQQQVGLIDQIRQATVSRYNAELADIERTAGAQQQAAEQARQAIDAQRQALARLRDFADGLGLSSNSPLTAFERLDVARSQFDTLAGRARGGDTEAISQLQQAAEALLAENRNVFGVSQTAVAEFERVQATLRGVAGQGVRGAASFSAFESASIDTSARIAQLQSSALAELQALDDTLATLAITQQAETEGNILALRERFDQAERHKTEIVDRIDPVIQLADRQASASEAQLGELRAQTAALVALRDAIADQADAGSATAAQLTGMVAAQEARVAAMIERFGRAVERGSQAVERA